MSGPDLNNDKSDVVLICAFFFIPQGTFAPGGTLR